jgi:hypothetical protein
LALGLTGAGSVGKGKSLITFGLGATGASSPPNANTGEANKQNKLIGKINFLTIVNPR